MEKLFNGFCLEVGGKGVAELGGGGGLMFLGGPLDKDHYVGAYACFSGGAAAEIHYSETNTWTINYPIEDWANLYDSIKSIVK